jgi:hypothetical protein
MEIVKFLWDKSREADEVMESLAEIGFTGIEGKLVRVIDWASYMLELVCPEGLLDGAEWEKEDAFLDEFLRGTDFETFYKNWFEEGK